MVPVKNDPGLKWFALFAFKSFDHTFEGRINEMVEIENVLAEMPVIAGENRVE
ncbi:MAG: hypothetical protein QM631_03305 [Dysgonomonas sp.]